MRRDQRDPAFLADMLRFALEVVELTNGVSLETYQGSLQIRRATERSIELIGEAARRVSETTKETITEIAWRTSSAFAFSWSTSTETSTTLSCGRQPLLTFRSSSNNSGAPLSDPR